MKRIPGHYLIIITFVFPSGIMGADVVKRVVFRRDKTATMYSGKLSRDGKRDLYVVGARKGQNLAVKLTIDDVEPFFVIYEIRVLGPDKDTMFGYDEKARGWSGHLPVAGKFDVQV